MAEKGVLDIIFGSIAAGWNSGAPSLPGPKVGRSMFSFGTERDRDLKELRQQYEQLRDQHERSQLADSERLDEATVKILARVFGYLGVDPERDLLRAAMRSVRGFLEDECYSFPDIDDARWATLSIEDRVHLRAYLYRHERLLGDLERQLEVASDAIGKIHAFTLQNARPASTTDGPKLTFSADLLSSLPNVAEIVEGIVQAFFEPETAQIDIFHDLRAQLAANAKKVSGIQPWETESTRQVVLPTMLKGVASAALPQLYLQHTPLADLFCAPVSLRIPDAVRFEHTHVIGGSGHGKTQLLQEMIYQDLTRDGESPSIVVIDSQGDLIRTISRLSIFDPNRAGSLADQLVIIDPNDIDFPVALNLFAVAQSRLAEYGPADRERVLNGVIDLYEFFFSSLLGAELTQKQDVLFRYLARLMLVIPGATIQTLRQLMEEPAAFATHIQSLDPSSRRFFQTEFASSSFAATRKQIVRRLWGILANPVFERMFSHQENRLDLFEALNSGKIILINTAKDLLKPEGASMLGRFFVARVAQAALERATLPERDRRPTFVYIDEAHDYFDDTIEHLLNQARKYRVGMVLAHQNLDQLSPKLRASVMSSASVRFVGGASSKDARFLADDMRTTPDFLEGMTKRAGSTEFACYVRNHTSRARAVSLRLGRVNALPSLGEEEQSQLLEANRRRYCVPREAIEAQLEGSAERPLTEVAVHEPKRPSSPSPSSTPVTPPIDRDPYLSGQGGREHKYLQQLVRQAAHERGWKADIEFQIAGGSIDVALRRSDVRIACEIAVTTTPEHEGHNVSKGLAAGFSEVWLIAPNAKRKAQLIAALGMIAGEQMRVLLPDEVVGELDRFDMTQDTETASMVRGYRVKVRRTAVSLEGAKARSDRVNRIIANSLMKKDD